MWKNKPANVAATFEFLANHVKLEAEIENPKNTVFWGELHTKSKVQNMMAGLKMRFLNSSAFGLAVQKKKTSKKLGLDPQNRKKPSKMTLFGHFSNRTFESIHTHMDKVENNGRLTATKIPISTQH